MCAHWAERSLSHTLFITVVKSRFPVGSQQFGSLCCTMHLICHNTMKCKSLKKRLCLGKIVEGHWQFWILRLQIILVYRNSYRHKGQSEKSSPQQINTNTTLSGISYLIFQAWLLQFEQTITPSPPGCCWLWALQMARCLFNSLPSQADGGQETISALSALRVCVTARERLCISQQVMKCNISRDSCVWP